MQELLDKFKNKTAKIGLVGAGYVGLPLAVEFAKAGFEVTGFELDQRKVDEVMLRKRSYIPDVPTADVSSLVDSGKLKLTTNMALLADMDTVTICVPTPLKKSKDPDLSYIVGATETLAKYMHAGMLITLESTTYPGTTEELVMPMLSGVGESSLQVGADFFLCFSPERVDPGNKVWNTRNIPKVVGGVTAQCTRIGTAFSEHAVNTVVQVDCTKTAEMVKLLENTFRLVNIAMVNELAIMCDRMKINIWNVIEAAKTKPFGFMSFFPGSGVGGHCIAIDPFYFSWKAKQYGCDPRFIDLAGVINSQMPHYVVQKIQDALNENGKPLKGSHVHISGVAYKKDIDDVRESPALDVAHLLIEKGACLTYYDPYVPEVRIKSLVLKSCEFSPGCDEPHSIQKVGEIINEADCVVIATDHTCIDHFELLAGAKLVVDTRNALKGLVSAKVFRL